MPGSEPGDVPEHEFGHPSIHPSWFQTTEDGVILDFLNPGEELLVYASGLERIALQLFKKVKIAVTDSRVLLFEPKWPRGYTISHSYRRNTCSIVNYKERFDRSQLVVLRHDEAVTCLYFSGRWRDEATAFRVLLGEAPPSVGGKRKEPT